MTITEQVQTDLRHFFSSVREQTEAICVPLETEDYVLQCMDDVSPPKWHLAHVTWFFEEFVLKPYQKHYQTFDSEFCYLFNSYYNAVGKRHPRAKRGHLSRPTLERVKEYRSYVNKGMLDLLTDLRKQPAEVISSITSRTLIGLHHEKQHQELLFTDIKFNLFCNPLLPTYNNASIDIFPGNGEFEWLTHKGGTAKIGATQDYFAYDNERPAHEVLVQPFAFASRMITNGEYLEFINAGGYRNPEYWLSDGWDVMQKEGWESPLYWHKKDNSWCEFTLAGSRELDLNALVSHVSYYEADAFAQYMGCRLPYEREWESIAMEQTPCSYFILDQKQWPKDKHAVLADLFGVGWQWTIDSYLPYPGFKPESGALGEYNGKFMCNQKVLRGGSLFTPKDHIRASYRNFFPPSARWQRTHIRLAKTL